MNKTIIFLALLISIVFIHLGHCAKARTDSLQAENVQFQKDNDRLRDVIMNKQSLMKASPVDLVKEYMIVINQIRLVESYNGTIMHVQLEEGIKNADNLSKHFIETEYKGVKGLNIQITVDQIAKSLDLGEILNDFYLLEMNTDLKILEIQKQANSLIVKGKIYGI